MRILAAALGALLISTSQPALALGGHEQGGLQQTEAQPAEAPSAEAPPAEAPQPVMQEAETQPADAPQPDMQQAEAQPAEAAQPDTQQAEVQPAEAPPIMQQAKTQPTEAPQPDMQQAETQPAEAPHPDTQWAETQPAEAPQPDTQQAEAPQPVMQQAETQQAEALPADAPQPDMQQILMQQAGVTQGVAPIGEPQQSNIRQVAVPQVEPPQEALAAVSPAGLPRDVKWTVFVEQRFGTRLDVPSAVFATPDGSAQRGVGRQFKTSDGRATLAVYSQRNDARDTPASYLRKNLKSPRAELDYERVTPEFFAIAAVMRGSIYYSRCNFPNNAGRAIHCFDLKYPVQERQNWDGIVTRMSRSLRPLHGG